MRRRHTIVAGFLTASLIWALLTAIRDPGPAGKPETPADRETSASRTSTRQARQSDPPQQAIDRLLADGRPAPQTIEVLLGQWTLRDPAAVAGWLDTHRDHPDAARWTAHFLFTWADPSPADAADWLETHPTRQTPENLLALLGPWLESDPTAATEWAVTRIETIQREAILPDLLASLESPGPVAPLLSGTDPVVADGALLTAIRSLTGGHTEPDPGLARLARALARHIIDPETAGQARVLIAAPPNDEAASIPAPDGDTTGTTPPELPRP